MTTDPALLTRADRTRLAGRVRELDELDDLMRRPGLLSSPDEPPPLHRSRSRTENSSTSSSGNTANSFTTERTT